MFYHAYENYIQHAFPLDELKPLSCIGADTLGSYSLTLVDTLDMLFMIGNQSEFEKQVQWVGKHVSFERDVNVSVFETNIRVLGGLLSAHLLAEKSMKERYDGSLLTKAVDVGDRLLKAFDTATGIPFGAVNLMYGVPLFETPVVSTASAGTFSLEFGVLSRLTGDRKYEAAAKKAVKSLWSKRSPLGLVGNHINNTNGAWTVRDAGIGTGIDSFYEYLLKAGLLFNDGEYFAIFQKAYEAAMHHLKSGSWFVEVDMNNGNIVWAIFNSLQAFWPGLQVMYGDIQEAVETLHAFHGVWRRYGFIPEGFNLMENQVHPGQESYPLRPELAESIYYMYKATEDSKWLSLAEDIVWSLDTITRVPCGFAAVENVETHALRDHMESFFLSETLKYLYLTFAEASKDESVQPLPADLNYIFTTEAHPLPILYEWQQFNHDQQAFVAVGRCPRPSYLSSLSAGNFFIRDMSVKKNPRLEYFSVVPAETEVDSTIRTDHPRNESPTV
eukprot:TRINITY_DN2912_c0_g2_i1.p1 TRINITY_DN2912_c0_g2~~TRINITY_DN2912_c0_g2_i1.p1  ORF type:complete len:500 (-),score=68.83 TRINITY_DN2912_c0_g2_i1:303-1802(-)